MSFYNGQNGFVTFLDVIKSRDCRDFVSGTHVRATEIVDAYTESIDGFEEKTLVKTENGTFSFRDFNEGSTITLPKYETRTTKCYNANPVLDVDILLYERWENDGSLAQTIDDMKKDYFEGVMEGIGRQFFYGTSVDAHGFPGLESMVIPDLRFSAGGSTANSQSSLWFVGWGARDVSMVYGGGSGLPFSWSEFRRETWRDGTALSTRMVCDFTMYPAVRVKRPQSVAVVKNIESTLTDNYLYKALAYMQAAGFEPTCAYTTAQVIEKLRASRTATNPTGDPAPTPTDICGGIPIKYTTSLKNGTEAVDSTSGIISLA